jgi:hypothetical protein
MQKAWKKSIEYLKTKLHSNAKHETVNGSIYKKLYENPDYFFSIIKNLILNWRQKHATTKSS